MGSSEMDIETEDDASHEDSFHCMYMMQLLGFLNYNMEYQCVVTYSYEIHS